MFFSIVIPTYNRAHLLEKTLNSVAAQNFSDFELIVVDDGSTDDTEALVRKIIETATIPIRYVKQPNGERGAARNKGLRQAAGDYVLFFDSDDTLYPHHLETAKAYIERNSWPEFLHLRYDIKNDKDEVVQLGPEFDAPPNKELIRGNFLSCNGVFVRSDIALKNPFHEDRRLAAMEDWELWLRLAAQYPLHYVNAVTSSIINHDDRSVLTTKREALVNRVTLLMQLVKANALVRNYYAKDLRAFEWSCYSYVALHLALTGRYKGSALKYLLLSLYKRPASLFQRRFFATVKHIL